MDHNDFFWIWQQELSNKAETDTSIKQKGFVIYEDKNIVD